MDTVKRKIRYPFKWIQLIERFNYLNMNSCLHLSNELKESGKNFCEYASEILASYLWRSLFLVKLQAASIFISIFKGCAKSISYLALRFSKLRITFFKKYFWPSGHTTSLQYYKTSNRRQGIVQTGVTALCFC